ncbi:MAG TPA: 2-amino-4-hydroxy-6-hydroxymethyldihydropteridine diphosphokinase [Candidatus Baltobacteraceae bacterium]|jgi:2-amino-4-hydroxy-6-hydroxymethyldihydropteridine diphosphokinase
MSRAYIALGSNAGDPARNVGRGFDALGALGIVLLRSSLYRTPPWGKTDQPDFVNAVALLETALAPRALLEALKTAERRLGRTPGERWGPRVIDLDLLTYDDATIDEPDFHIPHAELHRRGFVLVPLAEIDPGYAPLRDALDASERRGIVRLP